MSAAMATLPKGQSEEFKTPTDNKEDAQRVENVWMKRSLEKQVSSGETSVSKVKTDSDSSEKVEAKCDSTGDHTESDFTEVKNKKEKRERELREERFRDEKSKRTDKKELERKDSVKRDKKETEDEKEEAKKKDEMVKKFDNVNYVEAPLPKTNAWGVSKSVVKSQPVETVAGK